MRNSLKIGFFIIFLMVGLCIGIPVYGESSTTIEESSNLSPGEEVKTDSGSEVEAEEVTTPIISDVPKEEKNAVSDALENINKRKSLEIKAIPPEEAVSFINKKLGELYFNFKDVSGPFFVLVLALAGLILLMPFINTKLKQYVGFSLIGGAILGFLFIHFGPVIVGLMQGVAQ